MTTETAIMKLEQVDPEKLKLIKSTIAKDCTDTELSLLLYQADRLNLDPLQKQIWAVKFADKPALIFVGRDGFLQFAHRSGQFDGMESGTKVVDGNIIGFARVYRKDMAHPISVEVDLKEYQRKYAATVPQDFRIWETKPKTMIQKVAESQALRRAFAISGVYSPEEIGTDTYQGEVITVTPEEKAEKEPADWVLKEREKEAKKKKQQDIIAS